MVTRLGCVEILLCSFKSGSKVLVYRDMVGDTRDLSTTDVNHACYPSRFVEALSLFNHGKFTIIVQIPWLVRSVMAYIMYQTGIWAIGLTAAHTPK